MQVLADECFDARIVAGLRRRVSVTLLTAADARLTETPDEDILDWAAEHDFVVLTHDVSTMVPAFDARVALSLATAGIVAVPDRMPVGKAIEDLVLVFACYSEADFRDRVVRLPL